MNHEHWLIHSLGLITCLYSIDSIAFNNISDIMIDWVKHHCGLYLGGNIYLRIDSHFVDIHGFTNVHIVGAMSLKA